MGVILPGVERDGISPPVFSWDRDGKRLIFVGVGRERFENSLLCHPLLVTCSLKLKIEKTSKTQLAFESYNL